MSRWPYTIQIEEIRRECVFRANRGCSACTLGWDYSNLKCDQKVHISSRAALILKDTKGRLYVVSLSFIGAE